MRKAAFSFLLLLLIPVFVLGQTGKPDSAQNILRAAVTEARTSKRNVFLVFHATWCIWCKRLETALESPEIKPIIERNYVLVRLDVKERGEKKETYENPGGNELLAKFKGTKSGLPFVVVLNRKGKMIANSNVMPKNQNIGYPGAKEEIDAFLKILKQTSPQMTEKERNIISEYFERNAPQ